MKPKVNDFFCGAGGVGIGFMQAGYDVIWACDFDKYAVDTYRHNVGDYVIQADIKKLSAEDIPHADVWAFGFPCQDLSVAGKQRGFRFCCKDCGEEWGYDSEEQQDGIKCPKCGSENFQAASRSGMFFEMMRLLDETRERESTDMPRALFVENVKGLKPYIPVLEAERIIQAIESSKKYDSRFRERQFTPNPASWLNAKGYLNEYTQEGGDSYGADRRYSQSTASPGGFKPSGGFKSGE